MQSRVDLATLENILRGHFFSSIETKEGMELTCGSVLLVEIQQSYG